MLVLYPMNEFLDLRIVKLCLPFLSGNSLIKCYPDIVDIKPANMEELTEVITAAEFHPNSCNTFVYSSSKGTIRLCDMRASALCDRHSKCKLIASFFFPPNDNIFSLSEISLRHGNHVSIGLKMCSEPALPLVSC